MLKLAGNAREVKYLINNDQIYVNGKKVKSYKLPVGLFDCVSFPSQDKYFRMTLNRRGKLAFVSIEKKEANKFIFQVEGKRLLSGARVQLNMNSGMNIILPYKEHSKYALGQSLLTTYPPLEIVEIFPVKEKAKVFVLSGRHLGKIAEIKEVHENGKEVVLEEAGEEFQVKTKSFIVVGMEKPVIRLSQSDKNG
jgi:small subunit ribosomal protein S4e